MLTMSRRERAGCATSMSAQHRMERLWCAWWRREKTPAEDALIGAVRTAWPDTAGIVLNVNARPGNSILGPDYRVLWGAAELEDTLCGHVFALSVPSFYQVNRDQAEQLYALAVEFANLKGGETALELYCGAGTITLALAEVAGRVIGAEIVPEAIENAKANAVHNGISNVEFFCGDAGEMAKHAPPRGCGPMWWLWTRPQRAGAGGN